MTKRSFFFLSAIFSLPLLISCNSNEWLKKHEPINYASQPKQIILEQATAENNPEQPLYPAIKVNPNHAYTLFELIDLSLSNHSDLKVAWQRAKQSTLASDLVKATYLPIINAGVIAGHQKNNFDFTRHDIQINERTREIVPNIALQWLLFDFGQRGNLLDASEHLTEAMQYNFDLINQRIVHQITLAYHNYSDAIRQQVLTESSLKNNQVIQQSVNAKRKMGFATVVDVAQANQLVSESKLNLVMAQNQVKNTYQLLIQAMDLNPQTTLKVNIEHKISLPKEITPNIEQWIKLALSNRPDVLASYEIVKAKEANVLVAEKTYLPKVFASAGWAKANGYFGVQNLPDLNQNVSGSNILVGITIPIYDGGSRGLRLEEAKSQVITSQEESQNLKNAAAHEIMIASNLLNSALQSHQSAVELVKTAKITYDAAFAAYQNGLGTITLVNEAAKNLTYAQTVENQTYTASLVAASTLAFTLGYTQNSQLILHK